MVEKQNRIFNRRTSAILVAAASTAAGLSQLMTPGGAVGATLTWANTNVTFSAGSAWVGGTAPANSTSADVAVFQGVPSAQPLVTGTSRSVGAVDLQSSGWIFTPSVPGNRLSFGTGVDQGGGVLLSGINSSTNPTGTAQFDIGINLSNSPVNMNYSLDTTFNGLFEADGTGATRVLNFNGTGATTINTLNIASGSTTIARTFTIGGAGTGLVKVQGPIIMSSSSTGTFAVDGSVVVELTNANNTQTQTRLAGGTLRIHENGNLGALPGAFVANNINVTGSSTLQLAAGVGLFTLDANRGIQIFGTTGRTLTIDTGGPGNTFVVNTTISNAGGGTAAFTKQGDGTLALNAANQFTSTINFAAGTLLVGHADALGTGTLRFGGGTLASTVPLTVNQVGLMTNASTIAGGQTITFAGQLLYSGTSDRTERFSQDAGVVTQVNGGMLISTTAPRIFTVGGTGEVAFNSAITETGGQPGTLRIINDGTVTLNVDNSYTGGTVFDEVGMDLNIATNGVFGTGPITWNAGTLRSTGAARTISNAMTLGVGDTKLLSGPADFTFTGPVTVAGGGQRVFSVAAGLNATFANAVGDTDGTGLSKAGAGTLILSSANTYTGGTNIRNGWLTVGSDAAMGASGSSISFGSSGTLLATSGTLILSNSISASTRSIEVYEDGGTIDTNGFSLATTGTATGVGRLVKQGQGDLVLPSAQLGGTHVNEGVLRIAPNGTSSGASQIGSLTVAGGARFDLSDNDAIFTATPRSEIQSLINSARNGGSWNGSGLTSSSAAVASPRNKTLGVLTGAEYTGLGNTLFNGFAVNATDVLVKFTYYGDTDFNGLVNFDDYSRTDAGFNNNRTGWLNGDFDGNGNVNFDDYALIDLSFNTQSGTLIRAMNYLEGEDRSMQGMNDPALQKVVEHFAQFGNGYATSFLNAVPEPTSALVFAGLQALACMRMRRRRVK